MINAALNLLPGAVGQGRPQIIPAVIANNTAQTPLPTSFSDPLWVVNPSSDTNAWRVDDWPIEHGGTFPTAGASCALYYDSGGALRCVWWDGVYTAPSPGGAAGGVLSGTYPNPGFAASALASLGIVTGSSTVTFSSSANSAGTTVTHNLGSVPGYVGATNTGGNAIWFSASTKTTTQVTFFGSFTSAISGTFNFDWIAVL